MGNLEKVKRMDYVKFLKEIKGRIISARIAAYRRLNRELIRLYWDVGKGIVDGQEKFGWGKGVVEKLSEDLMAEFNGRGGFSPNNLWRMRNFYLTYIDNAKLAQLVQEFKDAPNLQQLVGENPYAGNAKKRANLRSQFATSKVDCDKLGIANCDTKSGRR